MNDAISRKKNCKLVLILWNSFKMTGNGNWKKNPVNLQCVYLVISKICAFTYDCSLGSRVSSCCIQNQ